jgi:hypothetical protein
MAQCGAELGVQSMAPQHSRQLFQSLAAAQQTLQLQQQPSHPTYLTR